MSSRTSGAPEERARRAHEERVTRQRAALEPGRRRLWQVGGVLLLATVTVGLLIAVSRRGGQPQLKAGQPVPGASATRALFAGVPQRGMELGDSNAPVTLVEFADLQCPYCRRYNTDVLPTLVARYVRTGKVRLVFRPLTFIGPDSVKAAEMAAAAGLQNRLWQFVDLFYANQKQENSRYVSDGFLRQIAGAIAELDQARAMAERTSPPVRAQLEEADAVARRYGIGSTPSFLIARAGGPLQPLSNSSLTSSEFAAALDKAVGR